jgi:hypothetical protein
MISADVHSHAVGSRTGNSRRLPGAAAPNPDEISRPVLLARRSALAFCAPGDTVIDSYRCSENVSSKAAGLMLKSKGNRSRS